MDETLKEKLRILCKREKNISDLCTELSLNEYEILYLVRLLRDSGINISTKVKDDDIYLFDLGEREYQEEFNYNLSTDKKHEFKFVAISDTRFGSKSQQLSILNDIYNKAYSLGYYNVIHCGNLTEGLYSVSNIYADTVFLDDTLRQVDYIVEHYPKFPV